MKACLLLLVYFAIVGFSWWINIGFGAFMFLLLTPALPAIFSKEE